MEGRAQLAIPRLTPFVRGLIIVLVVSFVVEGVAETWFRLPVYMTFAVVPGPPRLASVWQVVTYVLVEPPDVRAIFGFLFGLAFLWWMLSPLEERWGPRRAAEFALIATLAAGVPAVLVGMVAGGEGAASLLQPTPLSGAMPVSLAALAAFAMTVRDGRIWFMGVLPLKALHLLYFEIGYVTLMFLFSRDPLLLVASLGAIVAGVLYVRVMNRPRTPKPKPRAPRRTGPDLRVIRGGGTADDDDDDESDSGGPRYLN